MTIQKPLFCIALVATAALAQTPRTMLFQGTVSKAGVALTGNHKVIIDICESDDIDADDCDQIYTNTSVPFLKGYYSVILGESTPLPLFNKQYYLQVSVDGTTPESRIALTSAPSALNAAHADSANIALKADVATLADSTKGGALRAAYATKVAGIESKKDSTFFSDGNMAYDDTISFGSTAGAAAANALWSIKGMLTKDSSNLKISAGHRKETAVTGGTTGNTSTSSIILTNEALQLYHTGSSWSTGGGGGSATTIEMDAGDITIDADSTRFYANNADPAVTITGDTTLVHNVFRTTQPAVLIIPTNSTICEDDPCTIDGQLMLATSIVCNGGSSNYATNNKLMVCRGHYGTSTMHWNAIQ